MPDKKLVHEAEASARTPTPAEPSVSHVPAPFRTPIARSVAHSADPLGGTEAAPEITSCCVGAAVTAALFRLRQRSDSARPTALT